MVGYPFRREVEHMLGGRVIQGPFVEKAMVVSERGNDFVLTIGQDFAIGYEGQEGATLRFFISESFTFNVIEPAALVILS